MRKELKLGLLLFAVVLTVNCMVGLPHFILGFLLMLSISLEIAGALPEDIYSRIKKSKKVFCRKK